MRYDNTDTHSHTHACTQCNRPTYVELGRVLKVETFEIAVKVFYGQNALPVA